MAGSDHRTSTTEHTEVEAVAEAQWMLASVVSDIAQSK